jgi:hypothetical protein
MSNQAHSLDGDERGVCISSITGAASDAHRSTVLLPRAYPLVDWYAH